MDPHTAVAMAVLDRMRSKIGHHKVICLATAHPAKFPKVMMNALCRDDLPLEAIHPSIEAAKRKCQKGFNIDHQYLEEGLLDAMSYQWEQSQKDA